MKDDTHFYFQKNSLKFVQSKYINLLRDSQLFQVLAMLGSQNTVLMAKFKNNSNYLTLTYFMEQFKFNHLSVQKKNV